MSEEPSAALAKSAEPSAQPSAAQSESDLTNLGEKRQSVSDESSDAVGLMEMSNPEKAGANVNPTEQILKYLEAHPLFKSLTDKSFMRDLAQEMQARVCAPNDTVIRKDTEASAMFFTMRGTVEIISEDGETVYDVIKEYSFFGEVGLLFAVGRTATVRAGQSKTGRVVLLTLRKERFDQLLHDYPEVNKLVRLEAEERFMLFKKRQEEGMKQKITEETKFDITVTDLRKVARS